MKITDESNWDIRGLECEFTLSIEIEILTKLINVKKQALRQQAKAIKRLNEENQALKEEIERLLEDVIERLLEDEIERLLEDEEKETIGPKLNEKKMNGVISSGL